MSSLVVKPLIRVFENHRYRNVHHLNGVNPRSGGNGDYVCKVTGTHRTRQRFRINYKVLGEQRED